MNIRENECYIDYLIIFTYHIEHYLRARYIYKYDNLRYLYSIVDFHEIIERVREDLSDKTGFMLSTNEAALLCHDAVEYLSYLEAIEKAKSYPFPLN